MAKSSEMPAKWTTNKDGNKTVAIRPVSAGIVSQMPTSSISRAAKTAIQVYFTWPKIRKPFLAEANIAQSTDGSVGSLPKSQGPVNR